MEGAADDQLLAAERLALTELIPTEGGEWSGLLFADPTTGLLPRLTWTFTFPYQDVDREYGDSPVSLTVDWVPLAVAGWQRVAGATTRSTTFSERGEVSVYFFQHHRYDRLELELVEQRGLLVLARVTVAGDIDRLGIDRLTATAWLRFTGITVSLHDNTADDEALARLRDFTDTVGLVTIPARRHGGFHFVPDVAEPTS